MRLTRIIVERHHVGIIELARKWMSVVYAIRILVHDEGSNVLDVMDVMDDVREGDGGQHVGIN